jgi:hypothetical protein
MTTRRHQWCTTESFTVIHGGGRIDPQTTLELVEAARAWVQAAEPAVPRVVDVWAAPGHRLINSSLVTAAAFGAPMSLLHVPGTDDLVSKIKARGVVVRHLQARRWAVADAELRAIRLGWPIRYVG